jgi:hypothetical protein
MALRAEEDHRSLTVTEALLRAQWAAALAHYGTRPLSSDESPGIEVGMQDRDLYATVALAYSNIALALQAERDYEDRKVKEIQEMHE